MRRRKRLPSVLVLNANDEALELALDLGCFGDDLEELTGVAWFDPDGDDSNEFDLRDLDLDLEAGLFGIVCLDIIGDLDRFGEACLEFFGDLAIFGEWAGDLQLL